MEIYADGELEHPFKVIRTTVENSIRSSILRIHDRWNTLSNQPADISPEDQEELYRLKIQVGKWKLFIF